MALVTGGRSGIGRAIARRLVSEGARVLTAQRGRDEEAEGIEADLADAEAPARVVADGVARAGAARHPRQRGRDHGGGAGRGHDPRGLGPDAPRQPTAPFLLIRAALPALRAARGAIVNVGSIAGVGLATRGTRPTAPPRAR